MNSTDGDLGLKTEERFANVFARAAIIDRKVAADLLGIDVKTLATLPIRTVPRGLHRGYTERDLRAFLTECIPLSVSPKDRSPRPTSSPKVRVLNFSERKR